MAKCYVKNLSVIFVILVLFGFPAFSVQAKDWYIDDEDPNNWNSLADVVWGENGVQSGDTIYVCTNRYGHLVIQTDDITFKPCPGKPIKALHRKMLISSAWTDLGNGRHSTSIGTGVSAAMEDDNFLTKASDENLIDGDWYYSDGVLYYRPSVGLPADHTVEVILGVYIIHTNGHDNITFDGVHFAYGGWGIDCDQYGDMGGKNITIKNCSFYNMRNGGINLRSGQDKMIENVTVVNNTFRNCGEGVVIGGYYEHNWPYIHNIEIRGNDFYDIWHTSTGLDWHSVGSSTDRESIGIQSGTNIKVYNNVMHDNFSGIVLWAAPDKRFENVEVYHNKVVGVYHRGIILSGGSSYNDLPAAQPFINVRIGYNYVIGNSDSHYSNDSGCLVVSEKNTDSDSLIFNNTAEQCWTSIRFSWQNNGGRMYNNISLNPYQYHVAASSTATNIQSDYNLYIGNGNYNHNPDTRDSLVDWQDLSGQDQNSLVDNVAIIDGHLSENSVAINSGLFFSAHSLITDFDGEPILDNPDIGCDEYYQIGLNTDVNNNSQTNSTDALLTLRHSLGLSMTDTDWQESSITGDTNCDGTTNSTDALLILRYSLGLDMNGTGWCGG